MENDEEIDLEKNEEISLNSSTSSSLQCNSYMSLPQEPIEIKEVNSKVNQITNNNEILNAEETLFRNPISILNSRKLGKTYAFYYINGRPLFTIGPDCN